MKETLSRVVIVIILLAVFLGGFTNRAFAQADYESFSRGILGDVLDAVGLHGLVENMYSFKKMVRYRGGADFELLSWLLPIYRSFSKWILESPLWPVKLVFLPAALLIAYCLPLYSQVGFLGVVLASGLLTGAFYMLPLFLTIEFLSKIGFVALHGKTMLKILLVLLVASAILLLFAYGYPSVPILFSSYALLAATLWFMWFIPILLYYRS
jgi:hypothetical protein